MLSCEPGSEGDGHYLLSSTDEIEPSLYLFNGEHNLQAKILLSNDEMEALKGMKLKPLKILCQAMSDLLKSNFITFADSGASNDEDDDEDSSDSD
ncbi:hypothetical protein V9T40_012718 [Parthenolecanium corni]|uniref:Uncharacterized protein n=1 Tax=Parthenolecanium corni TaxID=536013 RepID=A0AAN9TKW3_9HEMI